MISTPTAEKATHRKVLVGRIMAATGILLTAYGVISLIAIRRVDHLPEGVAMFALFAAGFGALEWLAIRRQPDNRAVWVPAWAALFVGISTAGWATALLIAGLAGLDVSAEGWERLSPSQLPLGAAVSWEFVNIGPVFGFFLMLTLWLLLFPGGQLPSARWRVVAWGAVTTMAALTALLTWAAWPGSTIEYGTPTTEYTGIGALVDPLYVLLLGISAICVVSLVLRYRGSAGDVRQQYRWVLLGTGALYFAVFVVDPGWQLLAALAGVTISVACYGVAVTKYRLYDIDLVISRTLVYGTLAVLIGVVYVVVVVVVGGALGSGTGSLALSILATAIVAVALEPVRQRVQRWANRLVYGTRATPYEVLSDLSARLAGAEPAQVVLERMARLMAQGSGAEQTTVWVGNRGHLVAAAGWPELPASAEAGGLDDLSGVSYPVVHDGELVGALEVTKQRADPITPAEDRLLADLAGSAGLVLGNQQLNAALAARAAELRASRRRLVEAQDLERRRLERDLHDGAQQQVVALKVQIRLAEQVARRQSAETVADLLSGIATESQEAVDEIRALARGIYPPLLESEGLAAVVRSQAAASAVPVEVTVEGIARYPKDVESALYFAAAEAMANAMKHGEPSRIQIRLSGSEETLELQVTDDGAGFDVNKAHDGVGLVNIQDRIEALGGEIRWTSALGQGATVTARVPLAGALAGGSSQASATLSQA